jgi:hypothetical protein
MKALSPLSNFMKQYNKISFFFLTSGQYFSSAYPSEKKIITDYNRIIVQQNQDYN